MADSGKGGLTRIIALLVVLAAAGGIYFYMQSKPPKGGNLDAIVLEDSAGILSGGKTLEDVKKIFRHDQPETTPDPDVFIFDFSKVDSGNKAKVAVVIKGGKVVAMREHDDRFPITKRAVEGEPETHPPESQEPQTPPAEGK